MKAIMLTQPGPPEALQIKEIPRPEPQEGWVLIRIKAFGLNRSEYFTRRGVSPNVSFPRVLGIECVGIVVAAPGSDLRPGQKVAALMGGMGRAFHGSYAEYTLVPAQQVLPIQTSLPWERLAAIPETYLTAWGSLFKAMELAPGDQVLIRGGSSSVGMAAIALAKQEGIYVLATTRDPAKAEKLRAQGADEIILETGKIADEVKRLSSNGVDGVLELVGSTTLLDSLQATDPGGVVCFTGMLGNAWTLEQFEPLQAIPSTVKLTVYTSEDITAENSTTALQHILEQVEAGYLPVHLDHVFAFEEIVEAHRHMEENRATGKLVVAVDTSSEA